MMRSLTLSKTRVGPKIVCKSTSKHVQPSPVTPVQPFELDRRGAMLMVASLIGMSNSSLPAFADEAEFTTFFGLASPPTSYGGYGGNADEKPKYSFDYPSNWKAGVINKVDKGTKGIDCRLFNPRKKDEQVFVIALSRAGEDDKTFRLTDTDTTFQGFVGADFTLQDAVSSAGDIVKSTVTKDGQEYYIYDIDSPAYRYLCSITVKYGKIFAMFVACPTRLFADEEPKLRNIIETFKTLV